jgi:hypothetical protein
VDREAIRDVVNRYCHGVDRLDADCMKSAYWPDAVDEHGVFNGNAWEFVDHCMASHRRWRSTMHCVFNHHISLGPDGITATGEVYNISVLFNDHERSQLTWYGRYLDRYEKRADQWRIAHRVCVYEGSRVDPAGESWGPSALFRPGSFDRDTTPGRPLGP